MALDDKPIYPNGKNLAQMHDGPVELPHSSTWIITEECHLVYGHKPQQSVEPNAENDPIYNDKGRRRGPKRMVQVIVKGN